MKITVKIQIILLQAYSHLFPLCSEGNKAQRQSKCSRAHSLIRADARIINLDLASYSTAKFLGFC